MLIRKGFFFFLLVSLVFCGLSCTRLDQETAIGTRFLASEELPGDGSIPAHYGDLVSVSSLNEYPNTVQLWFQDEEGTLRMVQYSSRFNNFKTFSYIISRN